MLDEDQACFNLFDPNTYQDGQQAKYGQCYQPPSYEHIKNQADSTLKLLPNDREKFFEFIKKEQEVRLDSNVQQLYKDMNHSSQVEYLIHQELFNHFGYDDDPINHQLYYALTRKYSNDPELKPQIFFWRNNVMHGSRIKLNQIPPQIDLLTLEGQNTNLDTLMEEAQKEKKLLVVFSGNAMADYLAFAEEEKDYCKCYLIYIKEAHFVEKDENNNFVDGWPRGFFDYEYPQHKSQDQRIQMAQLIKTKYNINQLPILIDIYPQNKFDEFFGIWPDNMVVLKDKKLIWRGIINLDGSRDQSHSKSFKQYLPKYRY